MGGEHALDSNRSHFLREKLRLLIAMLRREPRKVRRYNEKHCVGPKVTKKVEG